MHYYYFMSVYLNTNELKLRVSQIKKRLAELSSMKEKIAFNSFKSESYKVVTDYYNSYGADAEKQYDINRRLAIADLDVKVRRYDSELSELRTIINDRNKLESEETDAYRRVIRYNEIERIQSAGRVIVRPLVNLMPVYTHNGIGGFIPGYVGIQVPFTPSPTGVFVSPAHLIRQKSMRN